MATITERTLLAGSEVLDGLRWVIVERCAEGCAYEDDDELREKIESMQESVKELMDLACMRQSESQIGLGDNEDYFDKIIDIMSRESEVHVPLRAYPFIHLYCCMYLWQCAERGRQAMDIKRILWSAIEPTKRQQQQQHMCKTQLVAATTAHTAEKCRHETRSKETASRDAHRAK